ncbi:hypothetical protein H9P43_008442 [Blastocladiella emersonii ATCC 22665]|nr:hypothetical protein H9P43_008442 [Blastocladiella emersonii ATCC 22665]
MEHDRTPRPTAPGAGPPASVIASGTLSSVAALVKRTLLHVDAAQTVSASAVVSYQSEIAALREKLRVAEGEQLAAASRHAAELAAVQLTADASAREVAALKARDASITEQRNMLYTETQTAADRIKTLESELELVKARESRRVTDLTASLDALAGRVVDLESALAAEHRADDRERVLLVDTLTTTERELVRVQADNVALAQKNSDTLAANRKLEAELDDVRAQLVAATRNQLLYGRVTAQRSEIHHGVEHLRQLEAEVARLRATAGDLDAATRQVRVLEEEKAMLAADARAAADLRRALVDAEARVAELSAELAKAREAVATAAAAAPIPTGDAPATTTTVTALRAELEAATHTARTASDRAAFLDRQRATLRAELAAAKTAAADADTRYWSEYSARRVAEVARDAAEGQVASLRDRVRALGAAAADDADGGRAQEISVLERRTADLEASSRDLAQKLARVEAEAAAAAALAASQDASRKRKRVDEDCAAEFEDPADWSSWTANLVQSAFGFDMRRTSPNSITLRSRFATRADAPPGTGTGDPSATLELELVRDGAAEQWELRGIPDPQYAEVLLPVVKDWWHVHRCLPGLLADVTTNHFKDQLAAREAAAAAAARTVTAPPTSLGSSPARSTS